MSQAFFICRKTKPQIARNLRYKKQGQFFLSKFNIDEEFDMYEKEADAMAEKISISSKANSFFKPVLSKISESFTANLSSVEESVNSKGHALDSDTKSFMEPHFVHDFSGVQIHNDEKAHQSSKEINALAYTHGNHIVFGKGNYQPQTPEGKKLLAHELTHVVQQNASTHQTSGNVQRSIYRTRPKPSAPIDNKKVQAYIDEALLKYPFDIKEAWLYLESKKEANCDDPNITPSIHYMFARHLVKDLHVPGFMVIGAILSYNLFKAFGVRIPSGNCPVSDPGVDVIGWGIDGVNDGEHK